MNRTASVAPEVWARFPLKTNISRFDGFVFLVIGEVLVDRNMCRQSRLENVSAQSIF